MLTLSQNKHWQAEDRLRLWCVSWAIKRPLRVGQILRKGLKVDNARCMIVRKPDSKKYVSEIFHSPCYIKMAFEQHFLM